MSRYISQTVNEAQSGDVFDVLFGIIVILLAGFSGYQTFVGFKYDYHLLLSVAIAIAIGLSILLLNLALRRAIKNQISVKPILGMFIPIIIVSFISNTNALYSASIAKDIVGETQEQAWRVFDKGTHEILVEIDKDPRIEEVQLRRNRLEVARRNLFRQITDELNPGLGEKSRKHLGEVERVLGTNITPLRAPSLGSPMQEFKEYARRLDSLIGEQADVKFSSKEVNTLIGLKEEIDITRDHFNKMMRNQDYNETVTDKMARDLEGYRAMGNDLLSRNFDFESVNNTADEYGAFNYTLRNFVNLINPMSIFLACIIALLLDLIPPCFALALLRPKLDY